MARAELLKQRLGGDDRIVELRVAFRRNLVDAALEFLEEGSDWTGGCHSAVESDHKEPKTHNKNFETTSRRKGPVDERSEERIGRF